MTRAGWGATALAAAVVAQWLLHQAWPEAFYPPHALGDAIIRATPGDLATRAIEDLGHWARRGMLASVVGGMIAAGAAAAILRPWLAVVAVAAMTILAAAVAPIAPATNGALAAIVTGALSAALAIASFDAALPRSSAAGFQARRRTLLAGFAGGFVLLAAGAVLGRSRHDEPGGEVIAAKKLFIVPDPSFPDLPGLTARITLPEDHYAVDIDLTRPHFDIDAYRLKFFGNGLAKPREFTHAELEALGTEERSVLMQCVSNIFAGDLMSNSLWTCVPLSRVLAEAGVPAGTTHLIAEAVDGYHERYTMEQAKGIFVALGMGGSAILQDHGFPLRLLVPGHYGVRSVKWLTSIEFVDEPNESYWEVRGWEPEAVMNIGARIDTPKGGAKLTSPVTFGGVAWGKVPVTRVEVSSDGGQTWQDALLEAPTDEYSWTRWQATIPVAPGESVLAARAFIGDEAQILESRTPHPSGATGLHRVTVQVA